jgi:hypothetical protein
MTTVLLNRQSIVLAPNVTTVVDLQGNEAAREALQSDWHCVLQLGVDTDNHYDFPRIQIKFSLNDEQQTFDYRIIANQQITIRIPLRWLNEKLFLLPPSPGAMKGRKTGDCWQPTLTQYISVGSTENISLTVHDIYLTDEDEALTITPDHAIIDPMGQYIDDHWPNKIVDANSHNEYLRQLYDQSISEPTRGPDEDRYGGWTGIRRQATGFFRVEQVNGRWLLIDPVGHAFYSHGVCYAWRTGEYAHVSGLEDLYQWLPDRQDPLYQDAWIKAFDIDEYKKRFAETDYSEKWLFNFHRANLIKAFGADWRRKWHQITYHRLVEWGLNTVGVGVNQFRDEGLETIPETVKLPYTLTLKDYPRTATMLYRDFPDVFSPEYSENARQFARQIQPFAEDRFMIGYFVTNEPLWFFSKDSVTGKMLEDPQMSFSKSELIRYLTQKYVTAESFSQAWGVDCQDFAVIGSKPLSTAHLTPAATQDMQTFDTILLKRYLQVPCEELRQVDLVHLNLGFRYGGAQAKLAVGKEFFDVISFNRYTETPFEDIETIGRLTDKPILIGEYHFSATDMGLAPSPCVKRYFTNQTERGMAYHQYVAQAIRSPYSIGVHYFEYADQPWLGRFDGENYGIGLVNIGNKPYDEMISSVQDSHEDILAMLNKTKNLEEIDGD